jgi:hypothetical protein
MLRDPAIAGQGYFGDMAGVREQLGLLGNPDAVPPRQPEAESPTSRPRITRARGARRAAGGAAAEPALQVSGTPTP